MTFRNCVFTLLCIFLSLHQNFSQELLDKNIITNYTPEDINQLNFKSYTVNDFSKGFDVALELTRDDSNIQNQIKGTNVLGALAKELLLKVKYKSFDLDAENTRLLLAKFEEEGYHISRPTPTLFMKLMNYSCQGDYSHIYERFKTSKFFTYAVGAIALYVLVLLLNVSGKFKWRFRLLFNRLSAIGLITICMMIIIFKLTCESNIQDYSFYGISM